MPARTELAEAVPATSSVIPEGWEPRLSFGQEREAFRLVLRGMVCQPQYVCSLMASLRKKRAPPTQRRKKGVGGSTGRLGGGVSGGGAVSGCKVNK